MSHKIPCTVEILTLNCEKTLEKCLESVRDFDDIIVLDGNSTDNTVAIAHKYGARVFPQKETTEKNIRIDDFSEVRNKGVGLARYKWFTFIDSDEYLSRDAVQEIKQIVESNVTTSVGSEPQCVAFRRPRKYVLEGQVIERASTYPNYQLRLFYLPSTIGFAKKVHEIMKLKPGSKICNLEYPEYVPLASIDIVRKKWSRYLDIQQESLRGLSFKRLTSGIRSNVSKACKYAAKYVWVRVMGTGNPVPFLYEFHNGAYHVRLVCRLIENYFSTMPPWDLFFRAKIAAIFEHKKMVVDIGGGLRVIKEKNNRYDSRREWIRPLIQKVDYKILDPVPDFNPDIVGDIHNLPFKDNSVDAFICIAVLEHVENPIKACEEMYRTLKPGGYCFIYVPFLFYYHAEKGYYGDFWRFTPDSLRYMGRQFSSIEIASVRGAIETWIHISPLGRLPVIPFMAHWLDKIFNKRKSNQVSGYNVFLVK